MRLVLFRAMSCNLVQFCAISCQLVLFRGITRNFMPFGGILCYFVQFGAILCLGFVVAPGEGEVVPLPHKGQHSLHARLLGVPCAVGPYVMSATGRDTIRASMYAIKTWSKPVTQSSSSARVCHRVALVDEGRSSP